MKQIENLTRVEGDICERSIGHEKMPPRSSQLSESAENLTVPLWRRLSVSELSYSNLIKQYVRFELIDTNQSFSSGCDVG